MNGKQSKLIRRMARNATTEHAKNLVEVKGTTRVRTAANGTKVSTVTMAHPFGSYRNVLKLLKGRGGFDLFNSAKNNHAFVEVV